MNNQPQKPGGGLAPEESMFCFNSEAEQIAFREKIESLCPNARLHCNGNNLIISNIDRLQYVQLEELAGAAAVCHPGDTGPYDTLISFSDPEVKFPLSASIYDEREIKIETQTDRLREWREKLYLEARAKFPQAAIGIEQHTGMLIIKDDQNPELSRELAESNLRDSGLEFNVNHGRTIAPLYDPFGTLVVPKDTYTQYVRRTRGIENIEP